ncbi:MAG: hypothetical protein RL701_701, partial [Pseudomonadota bacterium]
MSVPSGSHERQVSLHEEVVAGRYELRSLLARGGMGEVFAAQDRSTGKAVALKRMLPDVIPERGASVHFMREFHSLSALRHPRIIEVYDYGVDRGAPYYTMELLDGQDLRDLSPLPYAEACLYLRDVASSLALLHARRLLHRDVSPRNVRRTSDGHCKLIDFGAMIAFGVPPNVTGTAPCIPPEALQGANLDQRSDLYSLGALAYSVLTGRHGYAAMRLDELPALWSTPLVHPKRIAEIPDELDELIMSLMSLDPMRRPKSAAEVIDWLSAIGQLPRDDAPGVARSFFTSTNLCGRAQPTHDMQRHIQRAARGHGGAVLIEGREGVGKSRMLAEATLLAQTSGLSAVHVVARASSRVLVHELVLGVLQAMPVEAEAAGARRIVWPRIQGPTGALREANYDPAEQRARLQQSLLRVFCEIARARPLLLSVDDLDRADDVSVALLINLAHEASKLPLLIVATRTLGRTRADEYGREVSNADALRAITTRIRISDLMRGQNAELVGSMFGSVPNIELLNDWLFRAARGNPKLTLALAEHLFNSGLVRYVDGTWVLPTEMINVDVPSDLTGAWTLRLQGVSAAALSLAELLTIRRGGVSAELCLSLGGASPATTFAALEELVRAGVLESAGTDYEFGQDAVRKALEQRLSPERREQLHQRWAEALLADSAHDMRARLEAGWHLIHTQLEARGADMLAEVAPVFVDQGMALDTAIPALEKALEVCERLDRPLELQLRLRSTLVLAGYLFDYRLAVRYGDETIAKLYQVSGIALAQRLTRYLGLHLAFIVALWWTWFRRMWLPKARRGPSGYKA